MIFKVVLKVKQCFSNEYDSWVTFKMLFLEPARGFALHTSIVDCFWFTVALNNPSVRSDICMLLLTTIVNR